MRIRFYLPIMFVIAFMSCDERKHREVQLPISDSSLFVNTPIKHWVENPEIDEASGIAASYQNPHKFWVHNDSGGDNVLFLIGANGKGLQKLILEGIDNRDWEDIAVARNGTSSYIYIADTGDNFKWHSTKFIYRFQEPVMGEKSQMTVNHIETIEFEYPDGRKDAECILIDPLSKDIFIISNREAEKHIYRLKYPQSTQKVNTAELVGILNTSKERPTDDKASRQDLFVTSGSISNTGEEIIVKNYKNIFYWKKTQNETIAQALQRPALILPYEVESQGEAVSFSQDLSEYYTITEKGHRSNSVYLSCYKRKNKPHSNSF
ncbi:hypothetical protein [Flectobacillus longus]|uniref:hypothetical protein n=1 Tax=Flectobacillus longus TaxID=2984207 RepID=UPI0024B647CF|nr:hypothetical protein [Flectobacillus longus]MDI9878029.1 hypothetical protein [Flectobacillus longus]